MPIIHHFRPKKIENFLLLKVLYRPILNGLKHMSRADFDPLGRRAGNSRLGCRFFAAHLETGGRPAASAYFLCSLRGKGDLRLKCLKHRNVPGMAGAKINLCHLSHVDWGGSKMIQTTEMLIIIIIIIIKKHNNSIFIYHNNTIFKII